MFLKIQHALNIIEKCSSISMSITDQESAFMAQLFFPVRINNGCVSGGDKGNEEWYLRSIFGAAYVKAVCETDLTRHHRARCSRNPDVLTPTLFMT